MLLHTCGRLISLLGQIVIASPAPRWTRYVRRLVLLAVVFPLFVLAQMLHWIGFALDEILFRGYRRIRIERPVFVIGVPRSGTTFMHRLLAANPAFTTFSTWECLFAPSITERCLIRALSSLDRRVGRPLGRCLDLLERKALSRAASVHPTGLRLPEEDYLCFLPVLCCFILILPFPEAKWVWRMAHFDQAVPSKERDRLLRWYRRCLQKHLYFHGQDRVLLSKNASFAGMAGSLIDAFPDCRLVVCRRDALATIRSQFNSLKGSMRLFGIAPDDARFRDRLVDDRRVGIIRGVQRRRQAARVAGHAGRRRGRGSRHAGGDLRALPDADRLAGSNAAWPSRHAAS